MTEHDDRPAGFQRRFLVRSVTLEPEGDREVPVAVCPRRLGVLSVEHCRDCTDFIDLCINPDDGAPFMRCAFDEAPFVRSVAGRGSDPSGERVFCVADVMSSFAKHTDLNATLDHVLDAMTDTDVTPVVDHMGRAIGVISKADILQRLYDRASAEHLRSDQQREGARPERSLTVGDMMLSPTFLISSDAPLGQVAAILAYERLHAVLVVDSEQAPIGVVTALDLARWLACRSGYIVPETPQV
jgi:CBS domain-containing protein